MQNNVLLLNVYFVCGNSGSQTERERVSAILLILTSSSPPKKSHFSRLLWGWRYCSVPLAVGEGKKSLLMNCLFFFRVKTLELSWPSSEERLSKHGPGWRFHSFTTTKALEKVPDWKGRSDGRPPLKKAICQSAWLAAWLQRVTLLLIRWMHGAPRGRGGLIYGEIFRCGCCKPPLIHPINTQWRYRSCWLFTGLIIQYYSAVIRISPRPAIRMVVFFRRKNLIFLFKQ